MKIVVTIKQTFSTEARIAIENGAVSDKGIKSVVNPYDEFAVEEAIKAREAGNATEVVVLTLGPDKAGEALRQCLAMGADSAYRVWDDSLAVDCAWDAQAAVLAAALEKLKPWDLLMAGKIAVDDQAGIVVSRAAEILGIPQIATISKLDFEEGKVVARREMDGYQEIVEAPLPALVTADKSLNTPRYPTLPNIMKAKKKPLEVWSLSDVGASAATPGVQRTNLSLPPAKKGAQIIAGEPAEAAQKLAELLHSEAKAI
jgi:electron transfer flavoprotein beta subunit